MNIRNQDNFFTAGAHAIKKRKIFCSCSRFKTIPQLFSTSEIVSVVVTMEQENIFRSQARIKQFLSSRCDLSSRCVIMMTSFCHHNV